jgi:hypothetical protein
MAAREKSRAGATTTVGQQPGVADLHLAALFDGFYERIDFHGTPPTGVCHHYIGSKGCFNAVNAKHN